MNILLGIQQLFTVQITKNVPQPINIVTAIKYSNQNSTFANHHINKLVIKWGQCRQLIKNQWLYGLQSVENVKEKKRPIICSIRGRIEYKIVWKIRGKQLYLDVITSEKMKTFGKEHKFPFAIKEQFSCLGNLNRKIHTIEIVQSFAGRKKIKSLIFHWLVRTVFNL